MATKVIQLVQKVIMARSCTHCTIVRLFGLILLFVIMNASGQHRYHMQNNVALQNNDDDSILQYTSSVSARHCAQLCSADPQCKAANYDCNNSTCQLMADVLSQTEDRPGNIAVGECCSDLTFLTLYRGSITKIRISKKHCSNLQCI